MPAASPAPTTRPIPSGLFDYRPIVCPTCGVDDTHRLGQRGGPAHRDGLGELCTIVRCRRCGLIYPNPFPTPKDLHRLYSSEDGYFQHHADSTVKTGHRQELIARLERFTSGRRLLDVGAGLGETVAAGIRRGWDAVGIEPSSRFAAEANKLTGGRVLHGTLDDLARDSTSGTFDAVVLAAVLEHLHDPGRTLAMISRLMKPGAVLFIDVPNETGLYFRVGNLWMRLRGRDWVVNLAPTFTPFHVFGFSQRSLTGMLSRARTGTGRMALLPGDSSPAIPAFPVGWCRVARQPEPWLDCSVRHARGLSGVLRA
jgi:SAM-dependent methyltransferase